MEIKKLYKKIGIGIRISLFGILLAGLAAGCSGSDPEKKIIKSSAKKTIYTQSSNQGKDSIVVMEEQVGGNQQIRVILKRGGVESNITHQIDNSNFVISIPLQDPTSAKFGIQTDGFEREQRGRLESLLARYFPRSRFNVSLRIKWDQETLEEIQLKSVPFYEDIGGDGLPLEKSEVRSRSLKYELEQAVVKQEYKVFLDNTLPEYQEQFIGVLIPSQTFFNIDRGDALTIERTLFPSPEEDAGIKEQIERELSKYLNPNEFIVTVNFLKKESEQTDSSTTKALGELRMKIVIILNDTVVPEADRFVRETIPLTITLDKDRGDELLVKREQFPEKKEVETFVNREKLQNFQGQIVTAFESGEYAEAMELVTSALKVAPSRGERIGLLKMKGSLHFLLQDLDAARKTWELILRLEPGNEEATEMLEKHYRN